MFDIFSYAIVPLFPDFLDTLAKVTFLCARIKVGLQKFKFRGKYSKINKNRVINNMINNKIYFHRIL